jgi:hypothetical protein
MDKADNIQDLQRDLATRSMWNVGFYWSGLVYWILVLVMGNILPLDTAKFIWLAGGFFIVPIAMPSSRLASAEAFPKNNPLADLAGQTHATVIMLGFPACQFLQSNQIVPPYPLHAPKPRQVVLSAEAKRYRTEASKKNYSPV